MLRVANECKLDSSSPRGPHSFRNFSRVVWSSGGMLKAAKMHSTKVSSVGYIVEKTKFPRRIFLATSVITFFTCFNWQHFGFEAVVSWNLFKDSTRTRFSFVSSRAFFLHGSSLSRCKALLSNVM
ncbi:hypothetical protein KC19_VG252500 [Ceratodon purpureus]|uniref:Uncharacterized protein n=1 Tax=Ceratodon purpureus TaxID=3225 RepID=A0A8T0HTL3_CERPU|nr:hypothetical protein KC19_VG252500 [Ceratodon purpureus]